MSEQNRKKGKDFLSKTLHAEIGRGNRRYQTMHSMDYWIRQAYKPTDPLSDMHVQIESSVDISMRESDYDRLLEILGRFNTDERVTADRYYSELESRLAYERKLRNNNPALKIAYEKYKIMLDLVANGKDIED
jgi:hypothetical protein